MVKKDNRMRIPPSVIEMLEREAEPGETPQETLERLLRVRCMYTANPKALGMTYKEIAKRWGVSVSLVKYKVALFRETGGDEGLGPVIKLGSRTCIIARENVYKHEKEAGL